MLAKYGFRPGCGLMQESKDIQLAQSTSTNSESCGLMQESKDIQLTLRLRGLETWLWFDVGIKRYTTGHRTQATR